MGVALTPHPERGGGAACANAHPSLWLPSTVVILSNDAQTCFTCGTALLAQHLGVTVIILAAGYLDLIVSYVCTTQ